MFFLLWVVVGVVAWLRLTISMDLLWRRHQAVRLARIHGPVTADQARAWLDNQL